MTSSILLALLLPACGGGSVVLDDPSLDEEEVIDEEEEEEEEEEEVVEPVSYTAQVVGYNENWGGEYCTGEATVTLVDGVLEGDGSCETWGSATEIWLDGTTDGDVIEGNAGVFLDMGWGDPIEEEGDLKGQADQDELFVEFEVEVEFGGGGGGGDRTETFLFTIEGPAD